MKNVIPEYFRAAVARYIAIKSVYASREATKFGVAESTIHRWADGSMVPPDTSRDIVFLQFMEHVQKQFEIEVSKYVCYNDAGAKTLAKEFEVSLSIVARWTRGVAQPLGLYKLVIMEFMTK